MGRTKGSKNKRTETLEQKQARIDKCRETREQSFVKIESDSFTITSDSMQWTVEIGNRTLHFSRLDYLCMCLLSAKLKRAEVKSLEALLDAVRQANREILFSVGKVYPPNYGKDE